MKLHHFVGFSTAYKLAYQPMRTNTSWHENTSVFHDRLIFPPKSLQLKSVRGTARRENRSSFYDHLNAVQIGITLIKKMTSLDQFYFLWNGQDLSETISEDKWVRNTGLQISSFLFCRTIRRSCGLILPNDTLKQFDHNQLFNKRVQVSDGAQKIILERTKELPLRPCGCPLFAP